MAEKKAKKGTGKKAGEKKTAVAPKKATVKAKPKIAKKEKVVAAKPTVQKRAVKKTVSKATAAKAGRTKATVRVPSAKKLSEEERRIILRRSLVARREQIVKEAKSEISKYIKGENRQLVDTALDEGDWSVVDLSEDISLRQLSTHRENLQRIDEALRKLDEGTYGICEDCGEEISAERLKILPFAIYCTDCQERVEQMEEMERSRG